jgi:tRNA (mo5U34)-methyltransferase
VPDYLKHFPEARQDAVRSLHGKLRGRFSQNKKGFLRFREPYEAIGHLKAQHTDFSGDTIVIGRKEELSLDDLEIINKSMRAFMPWRKGPFQVFGVDIDSEWRSERKWNRLKKALPDLRDKIVADIGCNNGYYMFKTAPFKPRLVLGFEPYVQHYFAFKTLNHLADQTNLLIEPFGVEDINLFPNSFDVIFLMGIIYHRISPVEMLKEIREAMRPDGHLILESQAIAGDDPVALFPEKTYAKVPGTYFVPTRLCLYNWLVRAGFTDIDIFDFHPMSSKEQRKTDWMTFESYEDFIDPDNPDRTIEGYPAPYRVYISARNNC